MPELRWTSSELINPDHDYVAFASQLPAAGIRSVPAFMRHTVRITKQLRESPGLVAYSLRADLVSHHFWTLSVWQDEAALQAFVHAEPHASTMRELAHITKDPRFTTWTTRKPLPLPSWAEAAGRLTAQAVPA